MNIRLGFCAFTSLGGIKTVIRLSEGERVGAWFILLTLVFMGSMVFEEVTRPERMAKAGYMAYRIAGDTTVYWGPIPQKPHTLESF